ncbi:MAG: aquaporin [Candidatus Sericytochromatia bacterium]|nr:aquaporin [Candidatus Sericytochromatia bacterium]
MSVPLPRRLAAEAVGTALLMATVAGSGVMAERLAGGQQAVALLANALATGAGLFAWIVTFGPLSGAHFNPVVTWLGPGRHEMAPAERAGYVLMQVLGALAGILLVHLMYGLPALQVSTTVRTGPGAWLSELVATFALLSVLHGARRAGHGLALTAGAVALVIVAGYWATASTSFANPAVTLARAWTDTYTGIRPTDVLPFVMAQAAGAWLARLFWREGTR